MGDVRTVKDGDKVFTIGYPLTSELGKRARVSEGIVNSTVGVEDDPRMLQISVPIQPGNSGGPLFNNLGQVIGVVTSTINNAYLILQKGTFPQNVNFAMKINYLNNLVSLLPGDTNLARNLRPREINASQLMETTRNSILFIESSN
jgi:serine protease Do